jgi:hypothetical protein
MNQSKKILAKKPGSAGLLFFVPVLHRGLRTKFLRIRIPAGPMSEGGLTNSPWPLPIDAVMIPAALKINNRDCATTFTAP